MNPADKAQIEQAKWNAEMARRDAGNVMASVRENATRFTESAEKQLAYGVTMLAKTGNLGETEHTLPSSGIDVGTLDTPEVTQLKQQAADLAKKIAAGGGTKQIFYEKDVGRGTRERTYETVSNLPDLKDQLSKINETLSNFGGVADIQNPDALTFASGSDLLTMVTTRDAMERDKRKLIRNAQTGAMTALKAGENYDKMAGYAQEAAQWNTWNTVLGLGISVAGMAAGLGWAPFAAKAAQTAAA